MDGSKKGERRFLKFCLCVWVRVYVCMCVCVCVCVRIYVVKLAIAKCFGREWLLPVL